jgi:hypothetical protein
MRNTIQLVTASTLAAAFATTAMADPNDADRVSGTEKGSVLIFSKVEIRWDDQGNVIQDTFVDLTNDLGQEVDVNMYFVNGDAPLEADGNERSHPGWNWVDVKKTFTANQPAYWSALTGHPGPDGAPVAPFTILDPSSDPTQQGRPADDGSDDRVLRGFIVAFATDADCCPISWNHLKGDALVVNYAKSTAYEYNAWAFQARNNNAGAEIGYCGDFGKLALDGNTYLAPYSLLLLDFYAPDNDALGNGATINTAVTLHPVSADLRQETSGPISTKASYVIWNEDETQFTNLHRCITCWDQTLLHLYTEGGVQNHFLSLQTDKGKARIDGIASILCSSDCCLDRGNAAGCEDNKCQEQVCDIDPNCCDLNEGWDLECARLAVDVCDTCDSLQKDEPLLGIAVKHISFGSTYDTSALNLIGMGTENATIKYDPAIGSGGNPPTATGPTDAQPAPRSPVSARRANSLGSSR